MMNKLQRTQLDRLAIYIRNSVGSQDWEDHIHACSSYVAAMLEMEEMEVMKTLMSAFEDDYTPSLF